MATLQIYVSNEIKAAVEQLAAQEKRSASFMVREWIEGQLKRQPQVKSEAKIEEPQTRK